MSLQWCSSCLHVDSSRPTDAENYSYRTIQEAVAAIPAGTKEHPSKIYLEPDVYHLNGTPSKQGLIIDKPYLWLFGLGDAPEDVVLTDNRGHMVNSFPADGSPSSPAHTVLCNADGFACENLTIINTCNLDLHYPKDPSKDEKKYSDVITQAYALGGHGVDDWHFYRCNLLGMLDTLSIYAQRISFEECTVEGTNDFLEGGDRVYFEKCHLIVHGTAPMHHTGTTATVFQNCRFDVDKADTLFLTKHFGELILDNCDFHGEVNHVEWAFEPQYWQRGYYRNITLNQKPFLPSPWQKENSVLLTEKSNSFLNKDTFLNSTSLPLHLTLQGEDTLPYGREGIYQLVILPALSPSQITACGCKAYFERNKQKTELSITDNGTILLSQSLLEGEKDYAASLTVVCGDLQAEKRIRVEGIRKKQPALTVPLTLTQTGTQCIAGYALDSIEEDCSRISWFVVDGEKHYLFLTGTTQEYGIITIPEAAYGKALEAKLVPLISQSETTASYCAQLEIPEASSLPYIRQFNFSDFQAIKPVPTTNDAFDGLLCMTTYRPLYQGPETAYVANWEAGDPAQAFTYGTGQNEARYSSGLVTSARGAALRYTPCYPADEINLEAVFAPEKKASEGFGSANGQFLEIGLPFDPVTKTGYALRIERLPDSNFGCGFSMRYYENGKGKLLSDTILCSHFLTDCHVVAKADLTEKQLSVTVWSTKKLKADFSEKPVSFVIPLGDFHYNSLEIHHTGTVPLGNRTILESLQLTYTRKFS